MKEQWLAGIAHPQQRPPLDRAHSNPGTPVGHAHHGWTDHYASHPSIAPPGTYTYPPSPPSTMHPSGLVGHSAFTPRSTYPPSTYPKRPSMGQRAATYSYSQVSPPDSTFHPGYLPPRTSNVLPGSPTTNSSGPPSPESQESSHQSVIEAQYQQPQMMEYYHHAQAQSFAPMTYYTHPGGHPYAAYEEHHPHSQHPQAFCQSNGEGYHSYPAPPPHYRQVDHQPYNYHAYGPQHIQAPYHHPVGRPSLPTPSIDNSPQEGQHLYFARHPTSASANGSSEEGVTSSFYALSSASAHSHPSQSIVGRRTSAASASLDQVAEGVLPPVSAMYHSSEGPEAFEYIRSPEVGSMKVPSSGEGHGQRSFGLGLGVEMEGEDRVHYGEDKE